jgi:heme exporter protein A
MSNKLEINGLECIRDNRPIFKDINFSVKSNQTMLVRGKNGSGKTSLLRVLAGYIKNYSGNILKTIRSYYQNFDSWDKKIL